jgi:hypothetical protein
MKYMWCIGFFATLTAALVAQRQIASQSVVRELTEFKDQLLNAEVERNTVFLQQVLADDFLYVKTQGDVMNKDQLLIRVKSPEHTYEFLKSDSVNIRLYGDVAIMTDRTSTRGTNEGHVFSGDFRFVRIFVRNDGKWQVVLEQGTPIQEVTIVPK